MTDGFVSCSRRDREAVLPVVRAAEALDRSLRFDGDDIPAATLWRDELAEAIAAATDLAAPLRPDGPSLRWALTHMIEETGRHAGHADILRELIDGATGR